MTILRTALAVAIVLIVPGWLIVYIFMPREPRPSGEVVPLVIGCSIAVSIVAGLVLQLTSTGITNAGLEWTIGGTLVVLSGIAAWRAFRAPHGRSDGSGWSRTVRANVGLWLPCAAVVLCGCLALAIARSSALGIARRSAFTQLWLVPDSQGAQLGVASFEHSPMRYRVTVAIGRQVVAQSELDLAPGGHYTRQISLRASTRYAKRLEARLFLGESTVPYRTINWTPPQRAGNEH